MMELRPTPPSLYCVAHMDFVGPGSNSLGQGLIFVWQIGFCLFQKLRPAAVARLRQRVCGSKIDQYDEAFCWLRSVSDLCRFLS